MKDFDKYLKNINIPHFENKTHYELLEEKLKLKMQNFNDIEKIKPFFNPAFKYAYVTFLVIILVLWLFNSLLNPEQLEFSLLSVKGNIYLKSNDKKNYQKINNINKFDKSNTIKTDIYSNISFKLGNNYNINISQSSELKLLQSEKKDKSEICKIYMVNGQVEYSVKLPAENSVFQVNTEFSNFNVRGTKFVIDVKKNESVQLLVKEGKVIVGNCFKNLKNLKKIKKLDHDIYNELFSLINCKLTINWDDSIIIKKNDIDLLNNMIYENVYIKLINNKTINDIEKKEIIESINKIKIEKDNLLFSMKFEEKEDNTNINQKNNLFRIMKLPCKPDTLLHEKNTDITSNGGFLFIAGDYNKTIYCIDINSKIIKWRFKDENLMTVTSPVVSYKNEIVFGCPYYLFVLNNDGSIKIKKEIKNGPDYWINPVEAKSILFIPTSQTIYKYDGSNIIQLENFSGSKGPLYITYGFNKIYINDLNGKRIKIYDLNNNKIIWKSEELFQRAFMNPKITDNYIFIIDISGIIYRFDIKSLNLPPKRLNIKSGVMSNIIFKNNNLYFVANNGYFYKINADSFNRYQKIVKIDNDKNLDKYLTKKILDTGTELYYCGDNGHLFYYDCGDERYQSIEINKNSLIGSPVLINNYIYIVDKESNIYMVIKK